MDRLFPYLKQLFGEAVELVPFAGQKHFPNYLNDDYDFFQMEIQKITFLLMESKDPKKPLEDVVTQRINVEELSGECCVIYLPYGTSKQKNYLFRKAIPFIIPDIALYLPNGIWLQEEKTISKIMEPRHFTPLEQLIFLYLFYRPQEWFSGRPLCNKLGLAPMTISRTLRIFLTMGIVTMVGKSPRQRYQRINRKPYYELGKALMINPIWKSGFYINNSFDQSRYLISGFGALSSKSEMSNPVETLVIAIPKEVFSSLKAERVESFEINEYQGEVTKIEQWLYDPRLLSYDKYVDPLSLLVCLKMERDDPRVDAACKEMEDKSCEE